MDITKFNDGKPFVVQQILNEFDTFALERWKESELEIEFHEIATEIIKDFEKFKLKIMN